MSCDGKPELIRGLCDECEIEGAYVEMWAEIEANRYKIGWDKAYEMAITHYVQSFCFRFYGGDYNLSLCIKHLERWVNKLKAETGLFP